MKLGMWLYSQSELKQNKQTDFTLSFPKCDSGKENKKTEAAIFF
uniref:Uncharacterized protein n=1 Tax=Anguilla anguilla TaxID=7936 RepID=A0A0E9VNL8_ANGAN